MRALALAACGLALVAAGCASAPHPAADLVLVGGRIVTVDEAVPEAQALAARDGRIVAVGSDERLRPWIGEHTRVIELAGRLALPGFIESHGHFTGIGQKLMRLDLSSARSWDEIVARVAGAAKAAEPGDWIEGWGWHQEKWDVPPRPAVEGYPVHDSLSRATPDNPVILRHAAGSHAGFVNARVLELLGIGKDTPDPPGGGILRDGQGRPTGVLQEAAYRTARDALDAWRERQSPEERERIALREIELAAQDCLSKGVTSVEDAGSDLETIARLRRVADSGRLGVRLWVMIHERVGLEDLQAHADALRVVGAADDHFTLRAIKREVDGALGSHTAWLLEPYSDVPSSTGLTTTPLDELEAAAEFAIGHDFQLAVHAIGDRANREMLDMYQRVFARHGTPRDLRWRIEHAQHLSPADVPRFAELGVIASMQGIHCTSDGPWVPQRLGDKRAADGAYVWRSLLDAGATICNGTDAPVEDVDPIANFYASVTRRMADGTAFHAEQRMTRAEALRSYTINGAYAAFEEDLKGSLVPGKLADVVVLSRDILRVPEQEIREARVDYTIVGGEVLYERPAP